MLFVGQTRFSLFRPADPSWRLSKKGADSGANAYRERLYDDQRLALRADIFLNHTVPNLQTAADRSDHEVVHLVSYSESLPEPYQARLQQAAEKYPILRLDKRKDGQLGTNPADLAKTIAEMGAVFGIYRLDDDDVLPTTFFERVAQYMQPAMVGMLVSFPRGLEGIADNGAVYNVREGYYAMHSLGLMQVCMVDADGQLQAPLPSPHDKSDRRNPVIIDSRNIGYFRLNHAGQDHRLRGIRDATLSRVADRMQHLPVWKDDELLGELFPTLHTIVKSENPWGKRQSVEVQPTLSFRLRRKLLSVAKRIYRRIAA